MDAQRREINRTLKRLREALNVGDVRRFADELQSMASEDVLNAIREQKLLVKSHSADRSAIADAVRTAAETVLDRANADHYVAYLDFIELWQSIHRETAGRLSVVVGGLPKMAIGQLLGIFEKALDRYLQGLPSPSPVQDQTVAEYERSLHHINGLANDTFYAALRALNEASRVALDPVEQRLSPDKRYLALRRFAKAIEIAAELNGLEWVLDSVTYGDFVVSKVETASVPRIVLDHADARRSLLRELAIRRSLVLNLNRAREPRYVREMLKASETSVLEEAVLYYTGLVKIELADVDMKSLFDQSAVALVWVDAEDDLLALAGASVGDQQCATYYLSAMCLRWFELAAAAVRKVLPPGRRRLLSASTIPVSSIEAVIERGGGLKVAKTINDLLSTLPVRSHYDLVRRPFLRLPDGKTRCLPRAGYSPWTTSVRETLISGGAIGDAYGRMWEMFYARSFEETDWLVLGRNLTLRSEGKTTTEVDLLLKKDDLLLVVEIKALIGSGVTAYDHWRNRQTVEWGCRQAAAAAEFIRSRQDWLASVAGRQAAADVRHIQPLVLTTGMFDGWNFEGVPVIGEGGRKAITQGAKVDYTDSSGRVVSTRWISKPEELSTERILWSLNNPLELLIAPEDLKVRHRSVTLSCATVLIPEFDLRKDLESFPVIITKV